MKTRYIAVNTGTHSKAIWKVWDNKLNKQENYQYRGINLLRRIKQHFIKDISFNTKAEIKRYLKKRNSIKYHLALEG